MLVKRLQRVVDLMRQRVGHAPRSRQPLGVDQARHQIRSFAFGCFAGRNVFNHPEQCGSGRAGDAVVAQQRDG